MKQVSTQAQQEYNRMVWDIPTRVHIPGTRRYVSLTGVHPYTLERLTRLWMEREDARVPDNSSETLKSLCKEPYFTIKEAVIFTLNSWWKLHLVYPFKWRIWADLRGYTEEQMMPIIQEGKKKLPLTAHWTNMAFSGDMRTDWMKMTTKEAEQYRAELLSEVKRLSLKNSPDTGDTDGVSGISPTGVF